MTASSAIAQATPGLVMGIDVSKNRLDLAYSDGQMPTSIDYTADGLAWLLAVLKQRPVDLVVVESTGGIEQILLDALLDASIPVTRVQPGRVRHFAKASAQLAKTDPIDALILAQFGLVMKTRLLVKRPEIQAELDAMVTCRRQLIHVKTEQENRQRNVRNKAALKAMKKVLDTVEQQIKALDAQIKKLIDSDDDFSEIDRILRSVPGVGIGLSSIVLSSLGRPTKPLR
jgi:transposase